MATSNTFQFQSPQVEQIIREAYARVVGTPKVGELLVQERIEEAQRSLNFILSAWPNHGLNLWTIRKAMLTLYPNQSTYALPEATSDVLEVQIRTSNRNLGGTALASSGVAQNAFDNNSATSCTQTAPNGYIGYTWGGSQYAIQMVGIQSNVNANYTLLFQYSLDGNTWITIGNPGIQSYGQSLISWFVINVPTLGNYFRILETGGATLDIQELYFNTALNDTPISRVSRSDYLAYPQKNQAGRPSSYYVDRVSAPTITLWPAPNIQYNNLFFSYIEMPQDIGTMLNAAPIPSRFLEPLVSALSYKLSFKEKAIELIDYLKRDSDDEYKLAVTEDRERVPINLYGERQGWGRV